MTTIRTLIVVASIRQWHISQLDVKNVFLNGDLQTYLYCTTGPTPIFAEPYLLVPCSQVPLECRSSAATRTQVLTPSLSCLAPRRPHSNFISAIPSRAPCN